MMMGRIIIILCACVAMANCTSRSRTNEINISEGLYLPDDLEATLWAESPMLYNPTNMDVDARGRLWVTEAVNYRNYNNKDSLFLHHPKGDRIMILEDTNEDGRADISKVFVQDPDLLSPVGIAVIGNRIVVSCSPNLIVFTDENGDDVPDKKEILLNGFGGKDHDHSLHAVYAGADGEWYFNTGNAGPHVVTDKSGFTLRSGSMYTGGSPYNNANEGRQVSDDGKVWVGGLALRVRPDGTGLKVMAHNFRNSYEIFPDSYGNLWQNDNDDQVVACRTTWLMEGGNAGFFSTDGTRSWQADQRPGQDIFRAHWHQDDPGVMPAGDCSGAGAPTGVTLIEGDELGKNYRGMLLSADAGRNIIFGYKPQLSAAGYDLSNRVNLISSIPDSNERYVWNDTAHARNREKWFRPSDVTVGTDGALYVADWYDPVVGGHQMQDRKAYGRIYRIARKDQAMRKPVLDLSTTEGQLLAIKNPAINVRNEGYRRLLAAGDKSIDAVRNLLKDENSYVQARAIWLLAALGESGIAEVNSLLKDNNEIIRATAFRALRKHSGNGYEYAKQMADDPSIFVRREVIASLGDIPYETARPLLIKLAMNFDGSDRWYLEAIGKAAEGHEEDFYGEMKKALKQEGSSSTWSKPMAMLAWRLHPSSSVKDLVVRATDTNLPDKEREMAITALAFCNTKEAALQMFELSKHKDANISALSKYWLAMRQNNDWVAYLDWNKLNVNTGYERKLSEMKVRMQTLLDERQSDDERRWQTEAMVKDTIGAQMLIGLAAEKRLPAKLYPVVAGMIFLHDDPVIRTQASNYFKRVGDDKDYDIASIVKLKANIESGRKIFQSKCATCHVVAGKGGKIGPELTSIAEKFDEENLLRAVIYPDEAIVFGYEPWMVNTKDNESVFGFLVSDDKERMVIKDVAGLTHVFNKNEIASAKKQPRSLMPSAKDNGLTEQQLKDVVEFLKR